ncbi:MAG TPA: glutathione S-transferase [Glaciecola sp.]|jgi:glutathione S-transferase|nr:glutathione S-transferase [Glaciecola sp.]
MKLYGSFTSPYVRRLRLILMDVKYDMIDAPTSSAEGRAILRKLNPTMKIPMFEDNGLVLCDSTVIAQYLHEKLARPYLSIPQLNLLKIIDGITDSYIQLFLLDKSGFDTTDDKMYFNLQHERIERSFKYLENVVADKQISATDWNYLSISLYTSLDWVKVRKLHDFSHLEAIQSFYTAVSHRKDVKSTGIPA